MKIKKYKLIYDSKYEAYDNYDVYTNDIIKLVRDNANGCNLGYVYLMESEPHWRFVQRDLTDVSSDGTFPYYSHDLPFRLFKPVKTKEEAAKGLVKHQNKILKGMKL